MNIKSPKWLKKITTQTQRRYLWNNIYKAIRPIIILYKVVRCFVLPNSRSIQGNIFINATYCDDGFVTTHYVDFLDEVRFSKSFEAALEYIPEDLSNSLKSIKWRAHICCWAASQAIHLKGDFIDCGVWYGLLPNTICEYTSFQNEKRSYYLIDSFGSMEDSHPNYKEDIFKIVKKRFENYPNINIIRGLVPEALKQIQSQKVAYLAIDMNSSEPERAALEYFYHKIVTGGIIYLDDYGWGYPELRKVVDKFLEDKPETLLNFPSGNSIIVKL